MIPIVRRAHDVGLIDLAPGSFSGPEGRGNRNTRIRAAEPLQELFARAAFERGDVLRNRGQECIVLKEGDKPVEYEDTDETRAMRARQPGFRCREQDARDVIRGAPDEFLDFVLGPDDVRAVHRLQLARLEQVMLGEDAAIPRPAHDGTEMGHHVIGLARG